MRAIGNTTLALNITILDELHKNDTCCRRPIAVIISVDQIESIKRNIERAKSVENRWKANGNQVYVFQSSADFL